MTSPASEPSSCSARALSSGFDTVEAAIAAIAAGRPVIVTDDEDRENEGDLIIAAEKATVESINMMILHARGLICVPMTSEHLARLGIGEMVPKNRESFKTAFAVSVDAATGISTGISAADRTRTIQVLANPASTPDDLVQPGHIFPLKAKRGGVLRRAGHTEAAIDFARLAGFKPAGVLVEIMNEDGTMARLPDLVKVAKRFNLKLVSIKDLIEYRIKKESLISRQVEVDMPTAHGHFRLVAYEQTNTQELHLALVKGAWQKDEPVLVRVHSSCVTGDIFGSCRCDCGSQLHHAMEMVDREGKGVVLYMKQEGRGIGLLNKLRAYKLQEEGWDTVEANLQLGFDMDERDYGVGAQILRDLGVTKIRLMTNNPKKRVGLMGYGLEIVENVPIEMAPNAHNEKYLITKRDKLGHNILRNKK